MARLINQTKNAVVVEELAVAETLWSRFWGLMGRKGLADDEGLLIIPSNSVHTLFMRFTIDVVFLDRSLRVTKVSSGLRPFRAASAFSTAHSALELNAGAVARAQIETGDQLEIVED